MPYIAQANPRNGRNLNLLPSSQRSPNQNGRKVRFCRAAMTRVWERLFVAGREEAENLYRENPERMRTVLTVSEDPILRHRPEIEYVYVPIADASPLSLEVFRRLMDTIYAKVSRGRVLLHCAAGVSRSPILAAAYMHRVGYANILAALDQIQRLRPMVNPSPVLLASVQSHSERN